MELIFLCRTKWKSLLWKDKMIYLDNAATTKIHPNVFEAMIPWYITNFGNASSTHHFGKMAKEALDKARRDIADIVGCFPEEIIFTSGGTEADNLALFMSLGNILTSSIEHKAILNMAINPKIADVFNNGTIDLDDVERKIKDFTTLISVMAVNNETGVAQPYDYIASLSHKYGKIFHTDAVQAFGHRPIDIKNIDMMSVSGHKINGPKGIGFLYVNKHTQQFIHPRMRGGSQEFGYRAGTEPIPLIVGLAEAVKLHANPKPVNLAWFEDMLVNECNAVINGVSCHDDPWKNIINFQLDVHNDTMIQNLSRRKIYLSAGSACNSTLAVPSHVLKAMGLSDEECNKSLRISVGEGISMEDAKTVVNTINQIRKEQKIVDSVDEM